MVGNHYPVTSGILTGALLKTEVFWQAVPDVSKDRYQALHDSKDEGTMILQNVRTAHPTTQCHIPEDLNIQSSGGL
jgi:hypothetical protein